MKINKKQRMLIFILLLVVINYLIYIWYIGDIIQNFENKKNSFENKQSELAMLGAKKNNGLKLKKEIKNLKEVTSEIDALTQKQLNTPQIVYDFYLSCKKYSVVGDNVSFQLVESNNSDTEKVTEKEVIEEEAKSYNILPLTIELNVHGEKSNVERYLNHLDELTSRKLNVKSIIIQPYKQKENNNENASNQVTSSQGTSTEVTLDDVTENIQDNNIDHIELTVTFLHYIEVSDDLDKNLVEQYRFNNSKLGFDSLSKMFD